MFRHLRSVAAGAVFAVAATGCTQAMPATSASGSGGAKHLKVGWSTVYLTPSWMQETSKRISAAVDAYQRDGTISSYQTFNANGDTGQQIAQIQSMIEQKYDVILVDAGSSTALNPTLDRAVKSGITVVNFDSLVTDRNVLKVGTDRVEWGRMLAQWLVDRLRGKGDIIAFNGPAGVSVSEDTWKGAKKVFAAHPGIKIKANLNSEFNVAPAKQAFAAAYAANPHIDGVFTAGGALASGALSTILKRGGRLVPITGENYNQYLKLWQREEPHGFSSESTAQPNYLGTIALHAAVAKRRGHRLRTTTYVPLPKITDSNLSSWVAPHRPDDYYPIKDPSQTRINHILGLG